MGAIPHLLNPFFATRLDLSAIGLGPAIHIPVQITQREGGRPSYYLEPGREVLAGVYVTPEGIAHKYMKRESGTAVAETGDVCSTRTLTAAGEPAYLGYGRLGVVDATKGIGGIGMHKGEMRHRDEEEPTVPDFVDIWILWSCISVKTD